MDVANCYLFCGCQRVVEDIRRKGDNVDRVVDLSQELQDLLSVSWNPNIFLYEQALKLCSDCQPRSGIWHIQIG